MYLTDYTNPEKLAEHIREGFVEVRHHPSLPLVLYVHSRRCTLENVWDEVTTKTRGLIVNTKTLEIVARPFPKFFNINTTWKPETMVGNLPLSLPWVQEKLDGSLGTLYICDGETGIATKGSFSSEQALWATEFYNRCYKNAKWPEGYTPVFEIICESVQHHVVHYNGIERLVLIALINNTTGEELRHTMISHFAKTNGIEYADYYYSLTVADILAQDRPNTEGYVLSWRRPGQSPLKVKVKHPGFLSLQKVVHAATPKAILEHLKDGNTDLLDTWIGQTNDVLGKWVQEWVAKFNGVYGEILLWSRFAVTGEELLYRDDRKKIAESILIDASSNAFVVPSVCFSMLDGKDHSKAVWKAVERHFEKELGKPFVLEMEEDE